MGNTESPSQKLLRQHSRWRLAGKVGGIFLLVSIAIAIRIWVIEGVRIPDRSLAPRFSQGSWVWICKTQKCIESTKSDSPILLKTNSSQRILRVVAAGPGSILRGEPNGKISSKGNQYRLRGNPWFLEKSQIKVPRKGDSLIFSQLNPPEFDLALRLFRLQNPKKKLSIRPTLWIDGNEHPIEKTSIAQLHGIPVKPSEVGSLSWQELELVQMQILRQEHGSSKVEIRREVILKGKPLLAIHVKENCFFAICLSVSDCVDSRDLGYIPQSRIIGHAL